VSTVGSHAACTHTAPEAVGDQLRKLRKGERGWSSGPRMDRMFVFVGATVIAWESINI
jgi:hypothetical protein